MKSPRRNRKKPARPPTHNAARTQARLREDQVLLDNAFVGIFYVQNRRFTRTNRRAETLFGFAPGELIGRSTEIIYPGHATFPALGERADPTCWKPSRRRFFQGCAGTLSGRQPCLHRVFRTRGSEGDRQDGS